MQNNANKTVKKIHDAKPTCMVFITPVMPTKVLAKSITNHRQEKPRVANSGLAIQSKRDRNSMLEHKVNAKVLC